MKTIAATEAKNLLGQALATARSDLVMIERHGKRQVALMPAEEAWLGVLSAYSIGAMTRSVAMKRLGMTWYGELVDAMDAAGIKISIPEGRFRQMVSDIETLLAHPALPEEIKDASS